MKSKILLLLCLQTMGIAACAGTAAPADFHPNTTPVSSAPAADRTYPSTCPVTNPAWEKPPADPAVQGTPGYGYFFVNYDRSIWASAWWVDIEGYRLQASEDRVKVGWFRPAGAVLKVIGERIDRQSAPLEAHVPCCYPTRFQATGLVFPTEGCWRVTAIAGDSKLSFTVRVEP